MSVRAATLQDVPAIARVHVAAWKVGYRGLLADEAFDAGTVEFREAQWRTRIDHPTVRTLVAEVGGAIAGFIGTTLPGHDETVPEGMANIVALYVRPDLWSAGHGAALMDATLASLREDGLTRVTLWVLTGNDRAERFYERFGFARDGETWFDEERNCVDFCMVLEPL